MLQSSTQSRKVILTKDEKAYFDEVTDDEYFLKIAQTLKQAREDVNTLGDQGVDFADHYKDIQQQGKGTFYPRYEVSWIP